MNGYTSNRIDQVQHSTILTLNERIKELTEQGHDIINLSIGEPDFNTPDFIKQAAIQSIKENFTKYTAAEGSESLREAIVHKFKRDNQLDYQLNQVIVSNGVIEGIYNLVQSTLNPGDEMIILAPYWVSYPSIAKLAGAVPIIINTGIKQKFKVTPDQLEAAITPQTRMIVINSPNNPSGMLYSFNELEKLAAILKKHPRILIVSDDIYEYITWQPNVFINILNICPELKDRTIIFNGASKAFAMTGWRIGYAAGPIEIIQAMKKIQSQNITCVNSMAQVATIAALKADRKKNYEYMLLALKERHDIAYHALKKIKGVDCLASEGTFYLFPDVSKVMERLGMKSDIELSTHLLNNSNVAVVNGSAFGTSGYIRISITINVEKLNEAMERIAAALD